MSFSAVKVNQVVRALLGKTRAITRRQWREAVAQRVIDQRPDLAPDLRSILCVDAAGDDQNSQGGLCGLSIGEIGACYEALLALSDHQSRKSSGQFFTPDDAAHFMAQQAASFPRGTWVDPACGVGNLAWHLANSQDDPASFVAKHLTLVDKDETALQTAIALLAADFLEHADTAGLRAFAERCVHGNYLTTRKLPSYDYAILNPPYARAMPQPGYETSPTRDYFAYFLERVARDAQGFVAVTPAGYLSAPKFQILRDILDSTYAGGSVYVFDNVPDTLFRGYKFGSTNTSTTNFVRAAITVCSPTDHGWRTTPIMRWQNTDRVRLWDNAPSMLGARQIGPAGEWTKLLPGSEKLWAALSSAQRTIADLLSAEASDHRLDVALTPRYYISAAFRTLDRGSKATLYFPDAGSRDLAAIVLNSSLPYLWWRALDGGVTFPRRVLMSVPVPDGLSVDGGLVDALRHSETRALVVKLNAGRINENVKHAPELVERLDQVVLPELEPWQRHMLYANSMFPEQQAADMKTVNQQMTGKTVVDTQEEVRP